ncbi:hypothetical protein FRC09_008798, partial [Ceratobasidium sp. 395]
MAVEIRANAPSQNNVGTPLDSRRDFPVLKTALTVIATLAVRSVVVTLWDYSRSSPAESPETPIEPPPTKDEKTSWEKTSTHISYRETPTQKPSAWPTPVDAGCVYYRHKKYTASLQYKLMDEQDPLEVCQGIGPVTINGVTFNSPLKCEAKGQTQLVGTWLVESNDCERRKVSRLWNLSLGDNWKAICRTTPAEIDGKFYEHPAYCEDK